VPIRFAPNALRTGSFIRDEYQIWHSRAACKDTGCAHTQFPLTLIRFQGVQPSRVEGSGKSSRRRPRSWASRRCRRWPRACRGRELERGSGTPSRPIAPSILLGAQAPVAFGALASAGGQNGFNLFQPRFAHHPV
jgi:hypothetical protein